MTQSEERVCILIGILCAILIASHSAFQASFAELVGTYLYWLVRIGIEGSLFFATRMMFETYFGKRLNFCWITVFAIITSHFPFVLSITAMDIVLGMPELGMTADSQVGLTRFGPALLELVFLSDNHTALCCLLTVPRLLSRTTEVAEPAKQPATQKSFLSTLEPPLKGEIIEITAQEHYVKITTSAETRMILARFSDVLREMPDDIGMQVHRSHWVRTTEILEEYRTGQSMHLKLKNGTSVPVSRSFRRQVEDWLSK